MAKEIGPARGGRSPFVLADTGSSDEDTARPASRTMEVIGMDDKLKELIDPQESGRESRRRFLRDVALAAAATAVASALEEIGLVPAIASAEAEKAKLVEERRSFASPLAARSEERRVGKECRL